MNLRVGPIRGPLVLKKIIGHDQIRTQDSWVGSANTISISLLCFTLILAIHFLSFLIDFGFLGAFYNSLFEIFSHNTWWNYKYLGKNTLKPT